MTGRLLFEGRLIEIIDLPGVYSISTQSQDDKYVREYLLEERPDIVINVVDSNLLERNLALTFELMTIDLPLIVSLNMIDRAEKQGIKIDAKKIEKDLGVPVMPTSGLKGIGVTDLLRIGIDEISRFDSKSRNLPRAGPIKRAIDRLKDAMPKDLLEKDGEWNAEKLLLAEPEIENQVAAAQNDVVRISEELRSSLERQLEDNIDSIISSDRFAQAGAIATNSIRKTRESVMTFEEKVHGILTHRIYGLLTLAMIAILSFLALFLVGDFFASNLISWFDGLQTSFYSLFADAKIAEFFWTGVLGGVISVISIVFPYLFPFFLFLAVLEDSGYITRAAFVMDNVLHRIGLHGKAFFPMLLGYSCNVPACMGCRILETERERVLAIFAVTLIPCAATSIVIFGLVGTYVGLAWVAILFAFNLFIVAVLTRIAYSVLPGEPTALIMEMAPMRLPSLKIILKQTWHRAKDFVYIAVPLLIILGIILGLLQYFDQFGAISDFISPITVGWLGLPAFTGILLIFGIMRKELTLLLLATVAGTTNFGVALTDTQMIVFTIVVMLYIPCIATIGALIKEIGTKRAMIITLFEIGFAILVGGIAFRLLSIA